MTEESTLEYNARCKAWGDDAGGYRASWNNPLYPQPPASPANGATWAGFVDTDCGRGKSYRDWYTNDAPQVSGGTGQRNPPTPPPKRQQ